MQVWRPVHHWHRWAVPAAAVPLYCLYCLHHTLPLLLLSWHHCVLCLSYPIHPLLHLSHPSRLLLPQLLPLACLLLTCCCWWRCCVLPGWPSGCAPAAAHVHSTARPHNKVNSLGQRNFTGQRIVRCMCLCFLYNYRSCDTSTCNTQTLWLTAQPLLATDRQKGPSLVLHAR